MPIKIPTYQAQETINPLQGGGMRVQAEPQAFGVGLADKMGQVGMQVSQEIVKAQQEADADRAKDAFNQHSLAVDALETEAISQKGENVYKQGEAGDQLLSKAYLKKFQDTTQQIESTLNNDQQKKLFRQAAAQREVRFSGRMGEHEAKEMVGDQITKANMQIDTQMSGLSSDLANGFTAEADLMPRFGGIEDAVQRKAKLTGLPVDVLRKDAFSKANESILDAMVQGGDYAGAQKWASEHREWIDEKTMAHFDPLIKKGEEAKVAYDNVSSIMAKDLPFDQARKELHDKYKDNPMAFKTAEAELHAQFSALEIGRKKARDEAFGTVLDSMIGLRAGTKPITSWKNIQRLPSYTSNALSDEDRARLEGVFDTEQRERKAALGGTGVGASEKGADEVARYALLAKLKSDPEALSKMSLEEAASLYPQLGTSHTKQLMDDIGKAKQVVGTWKEVKFPQPLLKDRLKKWGEIKSDTKLTPQDEAKLGLLMEHLGPMVEAEQSKKQGKLDDNEWLMAVDKAMSTVKIKSKGIFGGEDETKAYQVRNLGDLAANPENIALIEERSRSLVSEGIKKLRTEPRSVTSAYLDNVTNSELDFAVSKLDGRGIPATSANVRMVIAAKRAADARGK